MKKIIAVDFYDLVWQQERLWSRDDFDRLFEEYAQHGVDKVLWRLSVCGRLLYRTFTPDMVTGDGNDIDWKCSELLKLYDPAEEAVRAGHQHGIKVQFWLTLYDESGYAGGNHEAKICREHPELSWKAMDSDEHYIGVLSYAYPECVEFKLKQIREIISYGGDGLYLCNRSHSRPPSIRKAMSAVSKEGVSAVRNWCRTNSKLIRSEMLNAVDKFGFDPPALEAFGKPVTDIIEWQKFRGTYFLKLIEQIRAMTSGTLGFGLRYGPDIPSFIYGRHFFDWDKLTDGTLIDELAYRLAVPPEEEQDDFQEFYQQRPVKKYMWMEVSPVHPVETIQAYLNQWERWSPHLDGVVFFEAYQMKDNKPYWDFLESL